MSITAEDLCLHCHRCGRRRFPGKHGGWRLISHEPLVVECPYCEFGEQLRIPWNQANPS